MDELDPIIDSTTFGRRTFNSIEGAALRLPVYLELYEKGKIRSLQLIEFTFNDETHILEAFKVISHAHRPPPKVRKYNT